MTTILRSLKDAHTNITSMAGLIGPESKAPEFVKFRFSLAVLQLECLMQAIRDSLPEPVVPDVWDKIDQALECGVSLDRGIRLVMECLACQ